MRFGLNFEKFNDGSVRMFCPDVPECDYTVESMEEAVDYIGSALPACLQEFYKKRRIAMPTPSGITCDIYINVPAKVQAKILLWNYMIEHKIKTADLARKLGVSFVAAKRLTDVTKDEASIESIETALDKLNVHFELKIVNNQ